MIDIYNVMLDIVALAISLITFLFTFHTSKNNIVFKKRFIYCDGLLGDNNQYDLRLDCEIYNKSKYPVYISKITFNGHVADKHKLLLGGEGYELFSQPVEDKYYSCPVPIKLDMYDYVEGMLIFFSKTPFKIKKLNLLTFHTSRGKVYYLIYVKNNKLKQNTQQ